MSTAATSKLMAIGLSIREAMRQPPYQRDSQSKMGRELTRLVLPALAISGNPQWGQGKIHWLDLYLAYGTLMISSNFNRYRPPPRQRYAMSWRVFPLEAADQQFQRCQDKHWTGSAHRWRYLDFDEPVPNLGTRRLAGSPELQLISISSALCQ
jgi:hypothetical protein